MAEEVTQIPSGWVSVRVRDPFPLLVGRLNEQDEMVEWLGRPTVAGQFHCYWLTCTSDDTAVWVFSISDPDVAFEFKLRFG